MAAWYEVADADRIASPALLVYPDRITENFRRMVATAGGAHRLRPHVKTHKMPAVVGLALAEGIRKFKAATIAEAEMAATAGAPDVLLAYPIVGPTAGRLAALVGRFPATRFRAMIDSDVGCDDLVRAAVVNGTTIDTLIDLDVGMHRTGVAPGPEALRLARRIAATGTLTFGGLHAYDGHLTDTDHERLVARVDAAFAAVWRLREDLAAEGIAVPLVVAGGTPTFPILAARDDVELGAGTTSLWDAGQPLVSPDLDFLSAAVLLTRVVSRPTSDRLCIDLGHKAVASEMPHPRVKLLGLEDATVAIHSEEHLVVETPRAVAYPPGTVVYALPRHVCPTVALHEEAVVVREGRAVDTWQVAARRRRITV